MGSTGLVTIVTTSLDVLNESVPELSNGRFGALSPRIVGNSRINIITYWGQEFPWP